ncbi:MAG: hypothetical protein HGJ98_10020 [Desulfosporosinus sp.]|nr:hypothetical protein [Desulfosporosinus sp.]
MVVVVLAYDTVKDLLNLRRIVYLILSDPHAATAVPAKDEKGPLGRAASPHPFTQHSEARPLAGAGLRQTSG